MIRFKTFFGSTGPDYVHADVLLNDWLEKNPGVYIINWQYKQARMGDHSICIEYDVFDSVFNSDEDLLMKGERKQDDR